MKKNIWERILVIFATIGGLILIISMDADFRERQTERLRQKHIDTVRIMKQVPEILEVKGTCYNAVADQCDATPLYTADGSYIDTTLLKEGKLRWLAISQDLLVQNGGLFKLGDTLYAFHSDPGICGEWVIHDCMHPRVKRYLDFLVPKDSKLPPVSKHILISKEKFYD